MKLLLLILLLSLSRQVQYERVFSTAGHTDMVVTASFFSDNQRMITGSNDQSFKIWSLVNFSVLHTITYADIIMNIGLHPTDNRIFVLVFDGNIYVYHQTTYALLQTIDFTGQNPNYIAFDTVNNKFIVGGLADGIAPPQIHFYDSTSYAHLSQIATTMPSGDQVNTISINVQNTHIAVTNLDLIGGNVAYLQFYNINTNSLINSFTFNANSIKWAIYDNSGSYLCSTFSDQSIKCYTYNSGTNMYVLDKNWNIVSLALGYPYCINFGITNQLIVTSSPNIVFFDMLATPTPTKLLSYADAEDIFVLDSNSNMQYLVTGGRNGKVGLWKQKPQNNNNQNITVVQNSNSNLGLIVGLSVGIPAFFIILLVIYCCFFGACKRWRQSKLQNNQILKIEDSHEITQNQLNSYLVPFQLQDKYIIIKGDDSDKSSEPDYDQLMAEGTIIIIKDEEKKKQYMKKLNKKRKNKHKNKKKQNGKQQDSSIQSLDRKQLQIEGHIIIIRDNDHSIKNKMTNNQSPDYNQLMAQENIIIIKDEDIKKKLVKKLKENKLHLNENDFKYIMAEETIIVIKDSEEQKNFIKQLMKQNDLNKIKHDQILANGDMIIIKEEQKKKQFVNSIKTEINKNNQKDIDYRALEIAEQIIIIRGDDDVNDTNQQTYEQLLAQGTVIVIRDQQIKKQYIKYKKQSNNNDEYSMMMAEQCIIVIRQDDDKQDYVNFIKKRNNETDKSSSVDYDELMNGNVMTVKEQQNKMAKNKKNSIEKKVSKNIESDPNYKQIVAQRNIIAINQDPYLIKVQKYGEYQITYEAPRQSQKDIDQRKEQNMKKNETLLTPNSVSQKIEKK